MQIRFSLRVRRAKAALNAIRRTTGASNNQQPTGVYWCGTCRNWQAGPRIGQPKHRAVTAAGTAA